MIIDTVTAKGRVEVRIDREDGSFETLLIDNLVVTAGKGFIASRMSSAAAGVMSHMAIGTGTTAPAITDTSLVSEAARVALQTSGGTVSGNVVTYQATFGAGVGTGAIAEAGIFNASSAGTMLNRVQFATVNKGASDTLTITWTVTVS